MARNNGKPTTRAELTAARHALELAETNARLRLIQEASGYIDGGSGRFINQLDRYVDPDGTVWYPVGSEDRRYGNNGPFITTERELDDAREAARFIAQKNSVGIGLLETITDFYIGTGVYATVTTKDDAPAELDREAQDIIDEFYRYVRFGELQQECVQRFVVEGEWFKRYFEPDAGYLDVRMVEPEYIRHPPNQHDTDWSWGCRNEPGDVQTILEYCYNPTGISSDIDYIDSSDIQHVKNNVVRNVKRGLSDFYATEETLENVRKLIKCSIIGEAVRGSTVGFWEYDKTGSSDVSSLISQRRDLQQPYTQHPISGQEPNFTRHQPGQIKHVPMGRKFVPPPISPNSQAQYLVTQIALRHVAVRWGFPEYVVSADASNNNYASILVAGGPVVKRVERKQTFLNQRFEETYWRALEVAHTAGRFGRGFTWDEVKRLLMLQLEGPNPVIANELQRAQANDILHRNGIISKQTWRQLEGLDNELEQLNLQEEPPPAPAAPALPGPGGPGASPFFGKPI